MTGFASKRVLITGGYGFVGRHLLRSVGLSCACVAVLGRRPEGGTSGGDVPPHEFLRANLTASDETIAQIRRFAPDLIFHLAGSPDQSESLEQARRCMEVNLAGTIHVLEAARECGAGVVVGDSVKSYGNSPTPYSEETPLEPNSSYAIMKVAAWHMAKLYSQLYGIPVVCVRPTLIYGPGQGLNLIEFVIRCLAEGRTEIRLKGGSQTRDPLFVSDAVRAYEAVGARIEALSGRVVNIGGGGEYSAVEIAEAIVRIAGGNAAVTADPSDSRPTEIWRSRCDNNDARKLCGWQPNVGLEQGIAITLDAMRKAGRQQKIA